MNLYDLLNQLDELSEELLEDCEEVTADKLGLDLRAGHRLWVNADCIVVKTGKRGNLDYYGGFQYVDDSCVLILGEYTVYQANDERVIDAISYWADHQGA